MNGISNIICEAWEQKNPELLKSIISGEFEWYESPYEDPITNLEELLKMWNKDLSLQTDIRINSEILIDNPIEQVAKVDASFRRNGRKENIAGVFVIKLNPEGKLIEFRQWWEIKP